VSTHFKIAIVAMALIAIGLSVPQAQSQDLPCDSFMKNRDGSWSALRDAQIPGAGDRLVIRAGSVLRPGAAIKGLDLATMLDRQCPAEPEGGPERAPGPGSGLAPVPAPVALGRYADANGNIDVEKLTCAQLTNASPAESELLLAWYDGWFSGVAKRRGLNLVRVKYAILNVRDYCKGNGDRKLARVLELMLK
jgi:HdeA/HdeB family